MFTNETPSRTIYQLDKNENHSSASRCGRRWNQRAINNMTNPVNNNENHHRLIILGSGPAGWTAAVYAARANLKPVVITGMIPGGQLSLTTDVDNWPGGKEGLQGPDLMESMKYHAERFNTDVIFDEITFADLKQTPFLLKGEHSYTCDALIIATGASAKYLGL